MDQPVGKRRRFRFGLRTLLVVVALAAVGSWGYWVAWPWWQGHREQMEFESALAKFHAGTNRAEFARLPMMWSRRFVRGSTWYDSGGDATYWFQYKWPNCIYVACFKYSNHVEGHEGTEYCV